MLTFSITYLILTILSIIVLVWAREVEGASDSYYIPRANNKGLFFQLSPIRKIAGIILTATVTSYIPLVFIITAVTL